VVLRDTFKAAVPPLLLDAALRLREAARFAVTVDRAVLARNRALKDLGRGHKVYLLATGPSLKLENLAVLKGKDVVSVSNFFLHPLAKKLAPKLHFFASVHPPLDWGNIAAWFGKADKALPAETAIVTTFTTKALVEQYGLFKRRQVYYLYDSAFPSHRCVDLERPVLGPQTIPLLALPVLFYMGYEEIGLLGCDHTVLRDFGRRIGHFFKPAADARKGSSDRAAWADVITSHEESLNVFRQYDFYRRIAAANGGRPRIVNYSQDSWLDLFPFKRLGRR
jgi:hypothetical protein